MKTLFALVAVLTLSTTALAAEAPAAPDPSTVLAPAVAAPTTVTLTTEQLAALVQAKAPAKAAAVTAEGILGMGWGTIGSILAAILGAVFMFWKGTTATRVQKAIPDLMDAAYWFVERNFGDLEGPAKAMLAMGKLYEGMTGHGFVLDPKTVATAQTRWNLLAEKNKEPQFERPSPAQLAQAQAAAAAATAPGSATDLADKAAR